MTTKTPKKSYKKKVRCQNCKDFTTEPGIVTTKYYCQKCMNYRRSNPHKQFPTKETIKALKEVGRWKK